MICCVWSMLNAKDTWRNKICSVATRKCSFCAWCHHWCANWYAREHILLLHSPFILVYNVIAVLWCFVIMCWFVGMICCVWSMLNAKGTWRNKICAVAIRNWFVLAHDVIIHAQSVMRVSIIKLLQFYDYCFVIIGIGVKFLTGRIQVSIAYTVR